MDWWVLPLTSTFRSYSPFRILLPLSRQFRKEHWLVLAFVILAHHNRRSRKRSEPVLWSIIQAPNDKLTEDRSTLPSSQCGESFSLVHRQWTHYFQVAVNYISTASTSFLPFGLIFILAEELIIWSVFHFQNPVVVDSGSFEHTLGQFELDWW